MEFRIPQNTQMVQGIPTGKLNNLDQRVTKLENNPGGITPPANPPGSIQLNVAGSFGSVDGGVLDLTGNTRGTKSLDLQSVRMLTEVASGNCAAAVGLHNTASGSYSSAFGYNNSAHGNNSSAFGFQAYACNCASAFGDNAIATGNFSSSFGNHSTSSGDKSTALGFCNLASGIASSASGYLNTASGDYSTAVGYGNIITTMGAAMGHSNSAYACDASSVGVANYSCGTGSAAFGQTNTARGMCASAFGAQNQAFGDFSSSSGFNNAAVCNCSTAIGYSNNACATGALAFGSNITNNTACSVAIGSTNAGAMTIDSTGNVVVAGTTTSTKFITVAGTSGQFVKGDGSLDSSTYLTTGTATSTYIPYTGATGNVNLNAKNLTNISNLSATTGTIGNYTFTMGGSLSPAVGGNYVYGGQYNGRGYWSLGSEYIWYNPVAPQWLITNGLGNTAGAEWYNNVTALTPPASGWLPYNGASGIPSLSSPASTVIGGTFFAGGTGDSYVIGNLNTGNLISETLNISGIMGQSVFGANSSLGTYTPLNVSFGGTFGYNTPGSVGNLKWSMYNDGNSLNTYGIGMSAALMEFRSGVGSAMAFFPNNGVEAMRIASSGNIGIGTATTPSTLTVNGLVNLKNYTVGTLPGGTRGDIAYVTDQLTVPAAKGTAPTGGGSVVCVVFYNGSGWVGI